MSLLHGMSQPHRRGLAQPPVTRPAPQVPEPVLCGVCSRCVPRAAATTTMFGWACHPACRPQKPDAAH